MQLSSITRALGALVLVAVLAGFAGALAAPPPPVRPAIDDSLVFREHGVRLTVSALSQTFTRKVTARWGAASNALGDATSYRVRWSVLDHTLADVRTSERIVTSLSDTLTVSVPLAPDSSLVRVSVWARRRGLESADSVHAWRGFNRADAPPPPPGPVVLDTVVQLLMYTPGQRGTRLAAGDSVETCVAYRSAAGLVGLLSSITRAPRAGESVASLAPTYAACANAAPAAIGSLTGMDFFGYPTPGIPPCAYPRGGTVPNGCQPKTGMLQRLPRLNATN